MYESNRSNREQWTDYGADSGASYSWATPNRRSEKRESFTQSNIFPKVNDGFMAALPSQFRDRIYLGAMGTNDIPGAPKGDRVNAARLRAGNRPTSSNGFLNEYLGNLWNETKKGQVAPRAGMNADLYNQYQQKMNQVWGSNVGKVLKQQQMATGFGF